ncbi:MAG: flagellar hook protein FlgE [Acidobacteriota bacterium]
MAFSSFFSGLAGLQAHSGKLNVIGDNLANLNTIGFKASRTIFADVFSQSAGGASVNGAGNPIQVGLGVQTASIDQIFSQGSLQTTGVVTDMAIQGNGFFVLADSAGGRTFSRAGHFTFDRDGNLVNGAGHFVQGFTSKDARGKILASGPISNIVVPAGLTSPPQATSSIEMVANLDANAPNGGTFSTTISVFDSLGAQHDINVTFTGVDTAVPPDGISDEWDLDLTIDGGEVAGGTAGTPFSLAPTTRLQFDATGQLISPASDISFTTPAFANGAAAQAITYQLLNPTTGKGNLTRFADMSAASSVNQDGFGVGQIRALTINPDGLVSGIFSNAVTIELAQVALATFNNPNGMLKNGLSTLIGTTASGSATIGAANAGGRGSITSSALELSNTDITEEFTDLIITERGYQANSRIITTTDQVIQEALSLKR